MNQTSNPTSRFNLLKAADHQVNQEDQSISIDQIPSILKTAFHYYKPIYTQLSELSMSPHLAVTQAGVLEELLKQQSHLALQVGGALLESFTYEDTIGEMVEGMIQGWQNFQDQDNDQANIHQEQSRYEQEENLIDTSHTCDENTCSNEHNDVNLLIESEQTEEQVLLEEDLDQIDEVSIELIATHTGRSIDLPTQSEWEIDPTLLVQKLRPTFEDGNRFNAEKADRYTQFLTKLEDLPRPIEIFYSNDFKDAYRQIQRIADVNCLPFWNSNGGQFCRAIARFIINYTRYLSSLDYTLRPNGMQGENAYQLYLRRAQKCIQDHNLGYVNGLDRLANPHTESWYQDTLNAYNRLKKEYDQLMNQPEILNGDQQLDYLRAIINREYETWELLDQVRLILKRTEITHNDSRLCAMLGDDESILMGSEFKALRASIRSLVCNENEENQKMNQILNHQEVFPEIEYLEGKRIVLVGGDRRNDTYGRLQKLLPESTQIEWMEVASSSGSKAVQSLQRRINGGGVDVVLLIQSFLSHSVSQPLKETIKNHPTCKSQMVIRGYGHTQLCVALQKVAKDFQIEQIMTHV